MDLKLQWLPPMDLGDGQSSGLFLDVEDRSKIPLSPGIYVFSRIHGDNVCPLYIGMAKNLRNRIKQQLENNVRLMRGIIVADKGYKTLHIARFIPKRKQDVTKALRTIESALISTALVEGHELLNVKGTKTLVHTITSAGNREGRRWLPENVIKLRRG